MDENELQPSELNDNELNPDENQNESEEESGRENYSPYISSNKKFTNIAIMDDTGKEIINALRALRGADLIEIDRRDHDRTLQDTTGKMLVEEIGNLATYMDSKDASHATETARTTEKINNLEVNVANILNRIVNITAESIVYIHKGSVPTLADLPENPTIGDVYDVESQGINYVWLGEKWDALGKEALSEGDVERLSNNDIDDIINGLD